MNPKQQQFADEYLSNGRDGAKAYTAVYKNVKSPDVAKAAASRLLTDVNVKAYVGKAMQTYSENCGITFESQLKDLERVKQLAMATLDGRSDLRAYIAAIQEQNKMIGLQAPTKAEIKSDYTFSDLLVAITTKHALTPKPAALIEDQG